MAAARIVLDRTRIAGLLAEERSRFAATHARSAELARRAERSLLGGVPMTWMRKWVGGHPVFVERASGARLEDVDGNVYVDFCLGDTGSMPGHGPAPVLRAIAEQAARGVTTMLPSADAIWAGDELARRFGLPFWSFTTSATDANRFVAAHLPPADRPAQGARCSTTATTARSTRPSRPWSTAARSATPGSVGPQVDPGETTVVVQFNDLAALETALASGEVACVLAEPALTNIGIVLPEPGFHDGLRELTRRHGTLLVIDETHCFSAGPGGCTARLRASSPTWSRSARRSPAASRPAPTASRRTSPRASWTTPRATTSTSAASAARSRATRCRWRRCAPRSARS